MASSTRRRTLLWLGLPAALIIAWLLDWGSCCPGSNDEAAIRGLLEQAEQLAEKHAVGDLLELATNDFTVSPRGKNRREVKHILFWAFKRYGNFSLYSPRASLEIDPEGQTADATVHYLLVKSKKNMPDLESLADDPEAWLARASEMANLFRVKLHLCKTDDGWLFASAVFQCFRGTGFK